MLEQQIQLKASVQILVPRDLPTLREIAEKAARACGAVKVVLFGSVDRGDVTDSRDLDLLLLLPDGADLFQAGFDAQAPFIPRFFAMDLIPMHISTFQNKDSLLALEIAKYGVVLYG
jgi:predicted nucleotidyltransferase